MIKKTPCESGCGTQREAGDRICNRCVKAIPVEVESPQEQVERLSKEYEQFIAMADEGRPVITKRLESLSPHNHLLVMSYFGGEWSKRNYPSPLTAMGKALGIILLGEAIAIMVPEDEKPWMVDGKATDIEAVLHAE